MILQNTSDLHYLPKRIISVVPSQTELLASLGLKAETVGITKFCVHPHNWFITKTCVGGTKNLHIDKIHQLQPDLLIANKEENVKEQIEELAVDYPVWLTDVNNLQEALNMIADIGVLTGKIKKSISITGQIKKAFEDLPKIDPVKTAYLIWQNPYMTIGGDTFIHDMLNQCGFQNIYACKIRYPKINIEQLQTANCQLLLLSSEPYPFKQKHIDELKLQLPNTKIILADGEFFSWYGSRLIKAPAYFRKLIKSIS